MLEVGQKVRYSSFLDQPHLYDGLSGTVMLVRELNCGVIQYWVDFGFISGWCFPSWLIPLG